MNPTTTIRALLLAVALAVPALSTAGDTPNITPGLWEYSHTVTMEGGPEMPPQHETEQECVTAADLQNADAMIDAPEGCTLDHVDMRSDGAEFTMTCTDPESGGNFVTEAQMRFMGDRSESVMHSTVDTPMGTMKVRVEIEGRRIGDC